MAGWLRARSVAAISRKVEERCGSFAALAPLSRAPIPSPRTRVTRSPGENTLKRAADLRSARPPCQRNRKNESRIASQRQPC